MTKKDLLFKLQLNEEDVRDDRTFWDNDIFKLSLLKKEELPEKYKDRVDYYDESDPSSGSPAWNVRITSRVIEPIHLYFFQTPLDELDERTYFKPLTKQSYILGSLPTLRAMIADDSSFEVKLRDDNVYDAMIVAGIKATNFWANRILYNKIRLVPSGFISDNRLTMDQMKVLALESHSLSLADAKNQEVNVLNCSEYPDRGQHFIFNFKDETPFFSVANKKY